MIVFLGLDGIQAGRFSAGHLVSFLLFLGYLTIPARGLAGIVFHALGNLGAAKRVLEILDAKPLVYEAPMRASSFCGNSLMKSQARLAVHAAINCASVASGAYINKFSRNVPLTT